MRARWHWIAKPAPKSGSNRSAHDESLPLAYCVFRGAHTNERTGSRELPPAIMLLIVPRRQAKPWLEGTLPDMRRKRAVPEIYSFSFPPLLFGFTATRYEKITPGKKKGQNARV